jgi:outer membrane protein assembly factor BamB
MPNDKGVLSGSLSVYGGLELSGELMGTASWAVSSSYSLTASYIASGMQIISSTVPSTDYEESTIWFDSNDGSVYTLYSSNGTKQWVGI